jgi:hypothetical protein
MVTLHPGLKDRERIKYMVTMIMKSTMRTRPGVTSRKPNEMLSKQRAMTMIEVLEIVDTKETHMVIAMVVREIIMVIIMEANHRVTTTIIMIMTTIVTDIVIVVIKMILALMTEMIVIQDQKTRHQMISLTLTWEAHLKTIKIVEDQDLGLDKDRAVAMTHTQGAMEAGQIL